MGVDYAGSGEIDAVGNARIVFAQTGIGGNWVCSTPENGELDPAGIMNPGVLMCPTGAVNHDHQGDTR
jgi:hypothetical protein